MDTAKACAAVEGYTSLPQQKSPMPQPAMTCPPAANPALRVGGLVIFTLTLAYPALLMRPAAMPGMSAVPQPPRVPAQTAAAPADRTAPEPPVAPEAQPPMEAAPAALVPFALTQNDSGSPAQWARSAPAQRWSWPKHLKGFLQNPAAWHPFVKGQAAAAGEVVSQRIVGWDPAQPEGQQLVYAQTFNDGTVKQVTEAQLATARAAPARGPEGPVPNAGTPEWWQYHRQQVVASIRNGAGVKSARDISTNPTGPGTFEITYLDGRVETRVMDPLVFDLAGKGVMTDARRTLFDLYGTGRTDEVQNLDDIEAGTGILVFDPKGDGRSGRDGRALFGDGTDLEGSGKAGGFPNGFEALRALVDKAVREGVLREEVLAGRILDAEALAALEKAYGLKMKIGGFNHAPVSLAEVGVAAIALSQAPTRRIDNFDGRANTLIVQPGAVFLRSDGSTGYYMNVLLDAKKGGLGLASNAKPRPGRL